MSKIHREEKAMRIADLPRVRSASFGEVYSNHVEAGRTFYDLSLLFCRISRKGNSETILEEGASVSLTWEHAVKLHDLLGRVIKTYQADFGDIRTFNEPNEPESQE